MARFPSRRLLLAGLLALAACGQAPTAGTPGPVASGPTRAPLQSLGTYTLSVTGATTSTPRATVRASALTGQEVGGLTFEPLSFGSFTDERAHVRHLRASFRVTNNSGAALTAPAYVPVDTEGTGGTTGETPFKNVRFFDGSDASARVGDLSPETAVRVNSATGAVEADPDATPLTGDLNVGDLAVSLPAGQTLAGISHRGWTAGALAAGGTQVVTFATSLPMAASPAQDPFAFDLVFSVADNPGTLALTNIAAIQGSTPSGDAPAALSGERTVEGVVTGLRRSFSSATRTAVVDGFFVQEEGIDADRDPTTSDGLFVFCGTDCPALTPGDRVRVTGTAGETGTVTQLTAASAGVVRLGQGTALPSPRTVALPLPVGGRERYEGMRLTVSGVVTNNFTLGRGASFDIADARLPTFTQVQAPSVTGLAAYTASLPPRTLRIDDGSRAQNPDPVIFARNGQPLSAANTLRGGDAVSATGVLTYDNDGWTGSGSLNTYRLYAEGASITGPERPAAPEAVGGTLRVGSMNVLNYFTTLVTTNEGCTPNGVGGSAARGANNCAEFDRQQTKIVGAITGLNPDVLGILEMQNDFAKGAQSSVATLVNALNAATAPGTYAYINPGANVGTDAISVAMIYKPGAVTPVGKLGVLDNTFDPGYADTCNRPTLAQTFQSAANGGRFTAVMAHLKSKGSACGALNDTDRGDGEGNGYQARLNAAKAIVNWLGTNPTGVDEADRVIFGDLNAYREEAPVQTLVSGGYANLFGPESYSYQFDGTWGSLDHALGSESLRAQVTGRTKWHINADEPTVLDYNLEFKSQGQQASFYAPDPFRSSDHDPVLIGLNLTAQAPITPPAPVASVTLTPDTADLTATADGSGVARSFTATAQNVSGDLAVTVTPQNGAPALASAPATVASGAPFDVTVTAPAGTAPGVYTYAVTVSGGGASDTSTLTVTVRAAPPAGTGILVISQLYGGGGNNGAPLRSDFVELFNRGSAPISTAGMSLQYASNTGAFTSANAAQFFALPTATVPAGGYFLVKLADGANTAAAALPTPDASGTVAMGATGGKVALVANTEAISGSADADVLDFVGFGTSANDREGSANAPAPSATAADLRLLGGCQDTNQNGSDFVTGAPAPRNSASPANVCTP